MAVVSVFPKETSCLSWSVTRIYSHVSLNAVTSATIIIQIVGNSSQSSISFVQPSLKHIFTNTMFTAILPCHPASILIKTTRWNSQLLLMPPDDFCGAYFGSLLQLISCLQGRRSLKCHSAFHLIVSTLDHYHNLKAFRCTSNRILLSKPQHTHWLTCKNTWAFIFSTWQKYLITQSC